MKPIRLKIDALHFFLADFATGWIFAAVQSIHRDHGAALRAMGRTV